MTRGYKEGCMGLGLLFKKYSHAFIRIHSRIIQVHSHLLCVESIWLHLVINKHLTNRKLATIIDLHKALVERCKHGDRKAQHELYRRYMQAMYHVALQITQDAMEAEDVLQEAFIRAFRNLKSFKGDSTFGAWLKRIVINTSINHLKKRKTGLCILGRSGAGCI